MDPELKRETTKKPMEKRECQNCKQEFVIEPEDFAFYKKIGVLEPKMCPLCRAQRRLAFRNERTFYKRPCDKCKKDTVSMYSPNKPYTVWCYECWFSDDWDAATYAKDYDPSRPFFEQFEELWKVVPKVALIYVRSPGSEYTNISADNKNCYMIIESSNNENGVHCYWIQQCRDLVDVSFSHQTELSYESNDCYNSYKVLYSKGAHVCRESHFLLDCRDCSNCVACVNLRNKKYHIFNKPVSKEEYERFLAEARLDTYEGVERLRKKFEAFAAAQPRRFAEIYNAPGSTGNYIENAKNCRNVFHCYDAENCKYSVHVWRNAKECVDADTNGRGAECMYNSMNSGQNASRYICSTLCWSCSFMWYSSYCFNSNHCFGSTGLRKKDYCILNRQYDKASYESLRAKIVEDMRSRGEYGEFFPASVSVFGYNESSALEQFPLTKEEALSKGFKWEDSPRGTFGKETISWNKTPASIKELGNWNPLNEVFACLNCKKNFRLIPAELDFYKRLFIPLPRFCPDCRHSRRFSARGPNRLWKRTCSCAGASSQDGIYTNITSHPHGTPPAGGPCPNEFETAYAPDRPEIVYCESCYQSEVI